MDTVKGLEKIIYGNVTDPQSVDSLGQVVGWDYSEPNCKKTKNRQ